MRTVVTNRQEPGTGSHQLARLAARYEVVVVGAGPAGSSAAIALATAGVRVLLVDRARFPRYKVCGGCLSPAAVASLLRLGIDARTIDGYVALETASFSAWRTQVDVAHAGCAVERAALDARLVQRARQVGVDVAFETRAQPATPDTAGAIPVQLDCGTEQRRVDARLVAAADGLGAGFLGEPRAQRAAYVGVGARVHGASDYALGRVFMAAGSAGYLGVVRLADGSANVAASLRADVLRAASPQSVVEALVAEAGWPALPPGDWHGTPPLRRRPRRYSAERVVALGDRAGFWEPVTGEGIGWALLGGERLAAGREALLGGWTPDATAIWSRTQYHWLSRHHRASRRLSRVLASPYLTRLALAVLRNRPALRERLLPRTPIEAPL